MTTKNTGIALATEIAEASKEALFDMEAMLLAKQVFELAPSEEMADLLWKLSGTVSAACATRITSLLLSESEFNNLVSDIDMLDEIQNDVLGN